MSAPDLLLVLLSLVSSPFFLISDPDIVLMRAQVNDGAATAPHLYLCLFIHRFILLGWTRFHSFLSVLLHSFLIDQNLQVHIQIWSIPYRSLLLQSLKHIRFRLLLLRLVLLLWLQTQYLAWRLHSLRWLGCFFRHLRRLRWLWHLLLLHRFWLVCLLNLFWWGLLHLLLEFRFERVEKPVHEVRWPL